ncbi:acyl-CoA dehydrogenase family protein [Peterkaempfera griseoplana]|uniref:acyl-CoA dehydrogenase family protein n=1 Tax=Peterkaempfera griseoplana TaxID=66896 RepID=UPI0006E35A27|nr:acyl-CoA dehydrogenase family protein [Peterkaempfera griseoplana]
MTTLQHSGPTTVAAAMAALPRVVDLLAARADELDREGTFPYQGIEAVHEAGLLTLTVGARYGGTAAGLADTVRVLGELGRGDASVALVAAGTLLHHAAQSHHGFWPEPLYRALLEESRRGPALAATLRSEPADDTAGPSEIPATVARRTPGGWLLHGRKTRCTGAEALSWMAVPARTDEPVPRVGTFLVRGDAPGIEIDPTWDHLGLRASAGHDVLLNDVLVPERAAVGLRDPGIRPGAGQDGPEAQGPEALAAAWRNLALPAVQLGAARAARDWLVGFLHRRDTSRAPAPRAALGEIEIRLACAEDLLTALAQRIDQGDPAAVPRTGPAGLLAVRAAVSSVEQALALAGDQGLSRANPLERHHRDILCGRTHCPQEDAVLTGAGSAALARAASR